MEGLEAIQIVYKLTHTLAVNFVVTGWTKLRRQEGLGTVSLIVPKRCSISEKKLNYPYFRSYSVSIAESTGFGKRS